MKLEPRSHDAEDAHEMLADLYIRCGRYHEAAQQLDSLLRIKPDDRDAQNARALVAAWAKHRNQTVRGARSVRIHADVGDRVRLPVSIHGQIVHWLLDTDANISMISESEARMLGISIDEATASAADSAGER